MARRPRGRVQVDDPLRRLPEQRVRPMAPDVFVGAPSVSGAGDGLRDLANALSGFAGSVGGLEKVFEARRQQDEEIRAREYKALPAAKRVELAKSGVDQYGRPVENPVISNVQGRDIAGKLADEFEANLKAGEFDLAGDVDVDAEFKNWLDPVYAQYGTNPNVQKGLLDEAIKRRDSLVAQQMDAREKKRVTVAKEGVFSTIRKQYEIFNESGADPDAKAKAINEVRTQFMPGGKAPAGLTPQQLDDMVFSFADEIADDDPDLARKLITEKRSGLNGEEVGPIGGKEENREATERILRRVVVAKKKQVKTAATETLTDAILEKGLKGGNISVDLSNEFRGQYLEGDPEELVITPAEKKKAVFEKWRLRSDEVAEKRGEPDDKRTAREIEELSRMGITNPDWEAMFKAFPQRLTEQNIQDPNTQPELLQTFKLYRDGRAASRYFMDAHLDKNTSKLLDLAYVAKERLGQSDDAALMSALRASDPNSEIDTDTAGITRSISKKVDAEYSNGGIYNRMLKETATAYVKLGGMSADEAVEAAQARLDQQGAEVNGGFVEIPRDPKTGQPMALPDDFSDIAERTIERWFDKYGDSTSYKPQDLTLRSSPNGVFEIVDKLGNPVIGVNLGDGATYAAPTLTLKDFMATREEKQQADLRGLVSDQNVEQTALNEGYMAGVMKYLEDLKTNDPSLGDSIKAHASVASKLAKAGFRGLGNALYPKTPQFSRDTYRLPNEKQ